MNVREISGITIGLTGSGKTFEEVKQHLKFIPASSEMQVDIMFHITSDVITNDYLPEVFSAKGLMNFNEHEYFVGYLPNIDYIASNLFFTRNGTPLVKAKIKEDKILKRLIKSLLLRRKAYKSNLLMSYSLFWYVFQLMLVFRSKSFIHAATLHDDKKNRVILLGGTGGCGKTSTAIEMLDNPRYKYLSEDFSIINAEGEAFFNPKPVSIYWSDIEYGSRVLNDFKCNFNIWQKLLLLIKRKVLKQNPLFKVTPENLFEGHLATSGHCDLAIYVIRTNIEFPELQDCAIDDIVERFAESSMRELKTYTEISSLILANDTIGTKVMLSSELKEKMKEIYRQFLKKSEYKVLLLPFKITPQETINFLEAEKLL